MTDPAAPSVFRPILTATAAAHAADQMALAALPLAAILLIGADSGTIGLLVAAQGAAWLAGSLPAGLLVDRLPRRSLLIGSQLLGAGGLALAALAAMSGSAMLLGAASFLGALGTVVFVLTLNSIVPDLVSRGQLGGANARIELARALVTIAAPILVGQLAQHGSPVLAFGLAAGAALVAAAWASRLPQRATDLRPRRSIRAELAEGLRFTVQQPLLRAITLCALFWNVAFFALIASFVPFALGQMRLDPSALGLAQAGYGVGLLAGALTAARLIERLGPNVILLTGPALSVAGPLFFLTAGGETAVAQLFFGQFLLGFGPLLWLVCQTSIRQLVTPPGLLGRVGATIQTAIYGVRPVGALIGGWMGGQFGPDAALITASVLFGASFLVSATSDLARLSSLPTQAAPCR